MGHTLANKIMKTTITRTIIDGKQVWVWLIEQGNDLLASGMGRTRRDASHDARVVAGWRTK